MVREVLSDGWRCKMICPVCRSENEMAYSVISHGFVCLENECGFELELDAAEADAIFASVAELACA
jgi:hypothetical protein